MKKTKTCPNCRRQLFAGANMCQKCNWKHIDDVEIITAGGLCEKCKNRSGKLFHRYSKTSKDKKYPTYLCFECYAKPFKAGMPIIKHANNINYYIELCLGKKLKENEEVSNSTINWAKAIQEEDMMHNEFITRDKDSLDDTLWKWYNEATDAAIQNK